jgi:F0F1-type ATP synthase membrane subunit c/vacuolar-type H+-ATPase subunit K
MPTMMMTADGKTATGRSVLITGVAISGLAAGIAESHIAGHGVLAVAINDG